MAKPARHWLRIGYWDSDNSRKRVTAQDVGEIPPIKRMPTFAFRFSELCGKTMHFGGRDAGRMPKNFGTLVSGETRNVRYRNTLTGFRLLRLLHHGGFLREGGAPSGARSLHKRIKRRLLIRF